MGLGNHRLILLRGRILMGAALLFCIILTHQRNETWRSAVGLWSDTAVKSPLKPRAHAGLGYALTEAGRYPEALEEFGLTYDLSFRPDLTPREAELAQLLAEVNISHILTISGHEQEAEVYLRSVWLQHPGFPAFAVGLSYYLIQRDSLDEAMAILNSGLSGLEDYPTLSDQWAGKLYLNRAAVFELMDNCTAANLDYQRAAKYPDIPNTFCMEN